MSKRAWNLCFTLLFASLFQPILSTALASSGDTPLAREPNRSPATHGPGSLARRDTSNSQGDIGDYYYVFWSDGGANPAQYVNLNPGLFRMLWGDGGNLYGGQGWRLGSPYRLVLAYFRAYWTMASYAHANAMSGQSPTKRTVSPPWATLSSPSTAG